jgi:hypothetical protein
MLRKRNATITPLFVIILGMVLCGMQAIQVATAATVTAPRVADNSIKIDASLDDWHLELLTDDNKITLTPSTASNINGTITDENDGSAVIYVAYDTENLYLGIMVTDDITYAEQTGDTIWQNDNSELWIDGANNAGAFPGEEDNYQLVVDSNGALHGYRNTNVAALAALVENAAARDGTNYTLEVRIPFAGIANLDMSKGMGFNITIVDADAAQNANGWNRLFWQGTVDTNTSDWGDLNFGDPLTAVESAGKLATTWAQIKGR